MNSFDVWGRGFFNLLLRRISERQATDADTFLRESGLSAPARTTAVLYYLAKHDGASVVDLVEGVGYTHQSISQTDPVICGAEQRETRHVRSY